MIQILINVSVKVVMFRILLDYVNLYVQVPIRSIVSWSRNVYVLMGLVLVMGNVRFVLWVLMQMEIVRSFVGSMRYSLMSSVYVLMGLVLMWLVVVLIVVLFWGGFWLMEFVGFVLLALSGMLLVFVLKVKPLTMVSVLPPAKTISWWMLVGYATPAQLTR